MFGVLAAKMGLPNVIINTHPMITGIFLCIKYHPVNTSISNAYFKQEKPSNQWIISCDHRGGYSCREALGRNLDAA